MQITLSLTKAEAEAVLRAELSAGHGVRRSQALQVAETKLHAAVTAARQEQEGARAGDVP